LRGLFYGAGGASLVGDGGLHPGDRRPGAGLGEIFAVLLVLLATVGMGIVLSMAAVVLRELAEPNSPDERRMAAMFFAAIPENLGYRQLRNLWLIAGFRPSATLEKQNRGSSAKQTVLPRCLPLPNK
jgi:hypothetical protein